MPLEQCTQNGEGGWKWGNTNKCWIGPNGKKNAIRQGIAIEGPSKFKEEMKKGKGSDSDVAFVIAQLIQEDEDDAYFARARIRLAPDGRYYLVNRKERYDSYDEAVQAKIDVDARLDKSYASAYASELSVAYIPKSERDKVPTADFAGPNRSYPIRNCKDVKDAARLVGHADNPDAVKSAIIRIAKRKGLSNCLPASWT